MKGKMLLQTPETGKFTVLAKVDSRMFTRRALILEHCLLLSELDRSISFMISEMRFVATIRNTPIAFFAEGVLEEIRETIFRESDLSHAYLFLPDIKQNMRKSHSLASRPLRQAWSLRPPEKYDSALKPEQLKYFKNKKIKRQKS